MMPLHTDALLQRARLLIDQRRYADAEQQVRSVLQVEPANDNALGLLARIRLDTQKPSEALVLAEQAFGINPAEDYYLYLMAFAYHKLHKARKAMATLDRAMALNPWHTGYFALYAFILSDQRRFDDALQMANRGLAIDPEDIGCLNARSRALNKLNRVDDAIEAMKETLAADPENDFSHASAGWNYLEKGRHKDASHHFREALRLNPGNRAARDGMKEALKSKIAPYRWSLQYGMWLHNKGRVARIAFILGIYILFRLSLGLANQLPTPWGQAAMMLVVLYLLAVIISWVIEPVANFFLIFHKEGRYALTNSEKIISQTVMAVLILGLLVYLVYLWVPLSETWQNRLPAIALVLASMALPLAQLEYPLHQLPKSGRQWYGAVVGTLGCLALVLLAVHFEAGMLAAGIYGAALIAGSWILVLTAR